MTARDAKLLVYRMMVDCLNARAAVLVADDVSPTATKADAEKVVAQMRRLAAQLDKKRAGFGSAAS